MREHRRFFAIHGSSRPGRPIKGSCSRVDVNWRGQILREGCKLWEIGTDTAKDLIHGRLRVAQPGPGYIHFPSDLPREFYEQLTAEVRVLQRTATGEAYRWVKRRLRNEKLDCAVYALFLANALDLHRYTGSMWSRLEAAVQPPADLFGRPDAAAPQTQASPMPPLPAPPSAGRRIYSQGIFG